MGVRQGELREEGRASRETCGDPLWQAGGGWRRGEGVRDRSRCRRRCATRVRACALRETPPCLASSSIVRLFSWSLFLCPPPLVPPFRSLSLGVSRDARPAPILPYALLTFPHFHGGSHDFWATTMPTETKN
eukprot:scaffold5860_cov103-Isochrysis_galbana.AAC.8